MRAERGPRAEGRRAAPLAAVAPPRGRDGREWDAVIVGASFGGLAAALELAGAGKVLLIDRAGIGEGQTSACATPLAVLERLGAMEALEQVHEEIVLHLPSGRLRGLRPRYPFATFDYRRLCRLLAERTDVSFLQARVTGLEDSAVVTSRGVFRAGVVIDASGWRAVLGSAVRPDLLPRRRGSLGLELRVARTDRGLHFWFLPRELRCGMAWLFPAGNHSRLGIACYRGKGGLRRPLEELFAVDLASSSLHGGYFPAQLRDPAAGRIFLVGDAAGQCLPLTGEGIRPALVFGQAAGRLVRQALEGELPATEALARYRSVALAHRGAYRALGALQRALPRMPEASLRALAWILGDSPFSGRAQSAYWSLASPALLSRTAALGPASIGERAGARSLGQQFDDDLAEWRDGAGR